MKYVDVSIWKPSYERVRFSKTWEPRHTIPWMYRALASPMTRERMLKAPISSKHWSGAYWYPLMHLLVYRLGWVRPDRGLRWWYDAGKPTNDTCLKLMSDIWESDGQLDWFAAWLWTTDAHAPIHNISGLTGYQDDGCPVPVDSRWIQEQSVAAGLVEISNPLWGGTDPLHLHGACFLPLADPLGEVTMIQCSSEVRRAVLMLDSMQGWYAALAQQAAMLPDLRDRSWHIDVIVRPVGLLGTFRQSRSSRLWFACRHEVHLHGT